ncbi:MAG: dihydropteroate synthase, partial [Gammaproteobacteria bacterium]
AALRQAEAMLQEGACIIDVGGESSRPGAVEVSEQEELDRVLPVIEALVHNTAARVSVDTVKPAVMLEAVRAGVHMINDIAALCHPGALDVVAQSDVVVCLMHMQGTPETMQRNPCYPEPSSSRSSAMPNDHTLVDPVVNAVRDFLSERLAVCDAAGVIRSRVCVDPGFGFGKTLEHNLALLRHLSALSCFGCPVLVGVSRKSMIGQLLQRPVEARLPGGLALTYEALLRGASIVRTHDVAPTRDVLNVWRALRA